MVIANIVSFILVLIGSINWGLVGIFDWNLVTAIFGAGRPIGAIIIYVIIMLAAIWLLVSMLMRNGKLYFMPKDENNTLWWVKKHPYFGCFLL